MRHMRSDDTSIRLFGILFIDVASCLAVHSRFDQRLQKYIESHFKIHQHRFLCTRPPRESIVSIYILLSPLLVVHKSYIRCECFA